MSVIEWQQTTQEIADIMLKHTRPFVTALSTETSDKVRLVGTGSFLDTGNKQLLLTCEHVARDQPMHFCFSGSDDVFKLPGPWTMDSHPIDAAYAQVNLSPLSAQQHRAQAIPLARFAEQHKTIEKAELLFFRGFAGENAHYGFGVHQTNGTGYCSQEKEGTGDKENFEIFWEPDQTQFTQNTPTEAQREIKFEDARGYSGSLVWNTRYLEITRQGERAWTPNDAVVTGLLRRWDPDTKTLLVWRIECFNAWYRSKDS